MIRSKQKRGVSDKPTLPRKRFLPSILVFLFLEKHDYSTITENILPKHIVSRLSGDAKHHFFY